MVLSRCVFQEHYIYSLDSKLNFIVYINNDSSRSLGQRKPPMIHNKITWIWKFVDQKNDFYQAIQWVGTSAWKRVESNIRLKLL